MTGPEREEEFEQFLQQRTILPHRLAETERFEPPAEVDRVVLARAKAAIHTPEPAPVFRPARWALPFGLAATLVIAFAVNLHLRNPVQQDLAAPGSAPPVVKRVALSAEDNAAAPAYARAKAERRVLTEASRTLELKSAREAVADSASPMAPQMARAEPESAASYSSDRQRLMKGNTRVFSLAADKRLSPEQWLAKIQQLRHEGKDLEAEREQAAFQKAYPNYRANTAD
jgi:hypothetical protein